MRDINLSEVQRNIYIEYVLRNSNSNNMIKLPSLFLNSVGCFNISVNFLKSHYCPEFFKKKLSNQNTLSIQIYLLSLLYTS